MPIARAIMRDGTVASKDDLLSGKVEDPKFPMTYIREVLKDREWDGSPHVTSLLLGTREYFLKNTSKYSINLDNMVIALAGTRFHANLENEIDATELKVNLNGVQGTLDLLEELPNGELCITDYKLVGSFALKKWIGITQKDVPLNDEYGNPVYLKSGPRKGQRKTRKETVMDPAFADKFNYTMQTNIYRVAIQAMLSNDTFKKDALHLSGFFDRDVTRCKIFFVLRDGSISHDFSYKSYLEDVEILPDADVLAYIEERSMLIKTAMENWEFDVESGMPNVDAIIKNCPPECNLHENWNGRKCESFCDVATACQKIKELAG